MLQRVQAVLSEAVMGFLALAALAVGIGPFLFDLSPAAEEALGAAEWAIVWLFAAEYAVNLALAKDRLAFVVDRWRVLDAAILVASFASLLPSVSDLARSTPALRILRLFRALLFGMRAGHSIAHPVLPPERRDPPGPPEVLRLRATDPAPQPVDWPGLLQWVKAPAGEWMHASNLPPERLRELAEAAGVAHVMVEAAVHESSYPRLQAGERWFALALSVPSEAEPLRRDPALLLVTEQSLLSVTRHPVALQRPPASFEAIAWGPRCALDVVRRVLLRNEDLAGKLEREVRTLETLPASECPDTFFESTFRLKRVLSMAKGDLWRLRALIEMLADGRRNLPGLEPHAREALRRLADDADFLYETVDNARESVLSLIDLHINVAAHETNRFMRLVAIVSTLGLIPAIAGGLLGMNLGDSPWPVTLGQVAFVTFMVMVAVLYTFLAKGWLRP